MLLKNAVRNEMKKKAELLANLKNKISEGGGGIYFLCDIELEQ